MHASPCWDGCFLLCAYCLHQKRKQFSLYWPLWYAFFPSHDLQWICSFLICHIVQQSHRVWLLHWHVPSYIAPVNVAGVIYFNARVALHAFQSHASAHVQSPLVVHLFFPPLWGWPTCHIPVPMGHVSAVFFSSFPPRWLAGYVSMLFGFIHPGCVVWLWLKVQ